MKQQKFYCPTAAAAAASPLLLLHVYFQRIITRKWVVVAAASDGSGDDGNQFETMPNYGFRNPFSEVVFPLIYKISNECVVYRKSWQMTSIITFIIHILYQSIVDIHYFSGVTHSAIASSIVIGFFFVHFERIAAVW